MTGKMRRLSADLRPLRTSRDFRLVFTSRTVTLLSYGLGPSAGQIRAGAVASITTPRFSLWSGGLLCVAAIAVTCAALPGLLRYRAAAAVSGAAAASGAAVPPGAA
jgi:hypothetical protein